MTVGLSRASTYAVKKESTSGTYIAPSAGTDFVPLRPKSEIAFKPEILSSDELLNDLGVTKSFIGKLSVGGSHTAYLKHSGTEGTEPEVGIYYESIMGSKAVNATEYPLVSGSTVSVLKVGSGIGANFLVGQPLLIKDSANGYSIRNISSISGDFLTLNFNLAYAPASGVTLGKAVFYYPAVSGHPTFSMTKYLGSGFAIESSAGNTCTELDIKAEANKFAEVDFKSEGTKYYYNAMTITSSNCHIDHTDSSGTYASTITQAVYATPLDLALAITSALNSHGSSIVYTCSYDNNAGMFTITSTSVTLSLLFLTGTNNATSIDTLIGFTHTDKTGATTYTSASALSYAASLTPSYDSADLIVMKGSELLIGSSTDIISIDAQSVSIKVSKKVSDVDSITEYTGIKEKIATSRTVEFTVKAVLKKHDAAMLSDLLNNNAIKAILNAGTKSGVNWVAGKCFNATLNNCTVGSFKATGDSFISVELVLKGFVTSTTKDFYLGFV